MAKQQRLVEVVTTVTRVYQIVVETETDAEAIVEARELYIDKDWDDTNEHITDINILQVFGDE